jgi:small-conductance mechanosensitive channel
MITQPVVNWSHSHKLVRRRIPVQVSYQSDIKKAMALMVEAAAEERRILANPAPRTLLKGFGSDGVDLELRMWIQDPQDGVSNIASDVMIRIWDKFLDNDIEFPYPQRVVHLKTDTPPEELAVEFVLRANTISKGENLCLLCVLFYAWLSRMLFIQFYMSRRWLWRLVIYFRLMLP